MSETRMTEMLDRHRAFWNREGDSPLQSVAEHRPLEDRGGIPLADGDRSSEGQLISPDLVDPGQFYAGRLPPEDVLRGDFFVSEGPPGLCWTEAAMGCPIRIATGGPWADHFLSASQASSPILPVADWLAKLDAFMDLLNTRSQERYPLTQPLFRGPIDLMASALGHEEACLLLATDPDASDAILESAADLFIDMAERRLSKTPEFLGGYLSSYGIWAPGTVVRTQADNATMISPKTYRERVLPYDRKIAERFDYSLIHLHSGCLHIIDDLLEVDALQCIQVSIDYPGGPLAEDVMHILRRILEVKPLIVTGPVYEHELDNLLSLEPSGGLCMQLRVVREAGAFV
jgi:hypothetical protein